MNNYQEVLKDFLIKKISFLDFKEKFLSNLTCENDLYLFLNNFNFSKYDEDMVMLIYIYLFIICSYDISKCLDNDFTSFIKNVVSLYHNDILSNLEIINCKPTYEIYKKNSVMIIINTSSTDVLIPLPNGIKDSTRFCINCGDEIFFEKEISLYPFGFYLIDLN